MDAWAENKMAYPSKEDGKTKKPPLALVTRQFEWRIQYAGPDEVIGTEDDLPW